MSSLSFNKHEMEEIIVRSCTYHALTKHDRKVIVIVNVEESYFTENILYTVLVKSYEDKKTIGQFQLNRPKEYLEDGRYKGPTFQSELISYMESILSNPFLTAYATSATIPMGYWVTAAGPIGFGLATTKDEPTPVKDSPKVNFWVV